MKVADVCFTLAGVRIDQVLTPGHHCIQFVQQGLQLAGRIRYGGGHVERCPQMSGWSNGVVVMVVVVVVVVVLVVPVVPVVVVVVMVVGVGPA